MGRGGEGLGLGLVSCNAPRRGRAPNLLPSRGEGGSGLAVSIAALGVTWNRGLPPPAQSGARGIIGPSPGTVGTLGAWRGWGKTPELPRLQGQVLENRTDLSWKRRVGQGGAKRVKGQPEAALEMFAILEGPLKSGIF